MSVPYPRPTVPAPCCGSSYRRTPRQHSDRDEYGHKARLPRSHLLLRGVVRVRLVVKTAESPADVPGRPLLLRLAGELAQPLNQFAEIDGFDQVTVESCGP